MKRICRLSSVFLGVLVVLVATVSAAAGQSRATTADLSGLVVDQSGAILPGASVTATNAATGLERTAETGGDGRFTLPALPPGSYSVRVTMPGFATQLTPRLDLALGQSAEVNFVMSLAAAAEQVTITAEAGLAHVQQTAVATVVSQQQIEVLPTNGRNFMTFSILTPGVTTDRTPQQGASATSGLTFAGQRARSNNITVDGLDNNDSTLGSVRATFSQEAVQEFQVITNSYSAEFGKASGGVVNIVTRSGGNDLRGNAFYYFRDEALNAKEHFERFNPAGEQIDRKKAPFSQHQFGGTLGGPIRQNRSFFFLSAERLDTQANNFVNIDDTTPVLVFGRNVGTTADILRRSGFPVEVGNVPYDIESTQALAKVDTNLTPNQALAIRFNWADLLNENIEPWGGQIARSRGAYLNSRDLMGAASLTSIVSSAAVNELRFQVANRDQSIISLDPSCTGVCDQENEGGPTLEIGAIGVGRHRFTPQPRENRRYQVLDTFSYLAGRHLFKTGVDFSYIDHLSQALPLHFGGRYIFAPLPAIPALGLPAPVNAVQALALGLPAAYVQGYGDASVPYGYKDVSVFAQDDWRVADDLTLKLGVRYQNQFWESTTRHVNGLPAYGWPTDNNNVAPRVAVAWNPGGDKRTAIQGSYGLFFDNHITAIWGITEGISGTQEQVRTLAVRIPSSIAAWRAPGHRLPEPSTPYPSLVLSVDPALKTPYAHHASAGVERELGHGLAMSAHFVYARGFDQLGTIDYNPVTNPATQGRPLDINGVPGTSASVLQYTSWGETWYRGLALSIRKRFNDRYQFLASYTLSKAEDTSADYQSFFIPQDNGLGRNPANLNGLPIGFDPSAERGPSLQDQRHRVVFSGAYALPWNVTVSSIVTLASGRPYNILAGSDLNGDGNGGATAPDRPRTDPANPATSIKRNAGLLPNQYTVDMRVAKRLAIRGRAHMDLMFEAFNLFNSTIYTNVDNIFGTGSYPGSPLPTFGQHTEAAPPFQAQLAVKFGF
ncbi:MAG TPA: TonB-dependent receptor [Vicinamibacterales bacterium]|nr:TonB-dependent receptor [Vicinamibacterales bacterium]